MKEYTIQVGEVFTEEKARELQEYLKAKDLELLQCRKDTLKELMREYQDNELDGKGYDFYFSIRDKISSI